MLAEMEAIGRLLLDPEISWRAASCGETPTQAFMKGQTRSGPQVCRTGWGTEVTALTVDLIELVSAVTIRGVRFALRAVTFIAVTMPLFSLDSPRAMAYVSRRFVAASYTPTAKFALGAFASYDFGMASLQVYLTRDVSQRGSDGADARGWARLTVPLDTDATSALPSRIVDR